MKKEYVRPMIVGEKFTPNEYIAACGDSGKTYKFVCDAQKEWGLNLGGSVYQETNGVPGLQSSGRNKDDYLGAYHSCSETHIVDSTDDFLTGYFVPSGFVDTGTRNVIIWRGEDGNNIHCTTQLDIKSWETAKS